MSGAVVRDLPRLPNGQLDQAQVVSDNEGMVRSIAFKVMRRLPPQVELDDLISYGQLGLLEAAQRFDPKGGAQFSSYAYYRVQGAIFDGLRKTGWLKRSEYAHVRAERGASEYLAYQANRAQGKIGQDRRTIEEEVAETADTVASLVTIFVTSLESFEHLPLKDERTEAPDDRVERKQMVSAVRRLVEEMSDEDQRILKGFYFEQRTLKELGEDMGLSKSWMSRKHAQCIERLRTAMENYLQDATITLGGR